MRKCLTMFALALTLVILTGRAMGQTSSVSTKVNRTEAVAGAAYTPPAEGEWNSVPGFGRVLVTANLSVVELTLPQSHINQDSKLRAVQIIVYKMPTVYNQGMLKLFYGDGRIELDELSPDFLKGLLEALKQVVPAEPQPRVVTLTDPALLNLPIKQ